MHASWSFQQGLLPFRDFFEHHMPGIYYLLAWLLRGRDVAHSFDQVVLALVAGRELMLAFAIAVAAFTFLIGWQFGRAAVGWMATALLSLNIVFVSRTLEIRPDVPGVALWTASQLALFVALNKTGRRSLVGPGIEAARSWFVFAGLLLGTALTFTQKLLLAGPGFALFSILYIWSAGGWTAAKTRTIDLVLFVAAAALPLLAVVAHFWANGATAALVQGVLTNNLGWIQEVTARATLRWMLLRDPLFCAVAVAGFVIATATVAANWRHEHARAAILLPTASLFFGMFIMPAPFPQYLLLVVPAAAVYGADFVWTVVAQGSLTAEGFTPANAALKACATAAFVIVGALGLWIAQPFFRNAAVYPAVGVLAIVATIVLARRHEHAAAAAVVIVAVSTYSLQQLVWMADLSNKDALEQMRVIHAATTPTDRVMDGFSGLGWFRPHAAFYWFTAPGVRPRVPPDEKARMVAMLADCRAQPAVVILDEHLRQLAPEVAPTVTRFYRPTTHPLVWLRPTPSPACGARPSGEVSERVIKSQPIR